MPSYASFCRRCEPRTLARLETVRAVGDSPLTRSRRSIGSGGESSSMLTSVEANAVQPEYLEVTVLRRGVGEVLVVAGRALAC
jgi:hypothetical protein